jgi:hypothetical protein
LKDRIFTRCLLRDEEERERKREKLEENRGGGKVD